MPATAPPARRCTAFSRKLNVDATELFFEMDGSFPNHHPDPTVEENLDDLKKAVREHRAPSSGLRSTATPTASARSMRRAMWSGATTCC